jgi:hypothetical protein
MFENICTSPSARPVRRSASIAPTQRKVPRGPEDEERLTADIIALARRYGRYDYRKIAGMRDRAARAKDAGGKREAA